jgi:hypothetical protein
MLEAAVEHGIANRFEEDHRNKSKNGAGSGKLVASSMPPQGGDDGTISNPHVLSDMGLAISL